MPENLQWKQLNEFQGLWEQDPGAAPAGAATEMTSCYPSHGVGLIPAFRNTALDGVSTGAGDGQTPSGLRVMGMFADYPVTRTNDWTWETDLWVAAVPSGTLSNIRFYRLKHPQSGSWQMYFQETPETIPVRNFALFGNYRPLASPSAAKIVVAASWHNKKYFFPDPATPTTDSTKTAYTHASSTPGPDGFCVHQGRLVWVEPFTASHTSGAKFPDLDLLRFTNVGGTPPPPTDAGSDNFAYVAGSSGLPITALISSDVDDLFVLKLDAAYLLQGSLSGPIPEPRIVRLANVPGGPAQRPAVTPWGVAYGVELGPIVFWRGGAGVQSISDGLAPGFWNGKEATSIFSGYLESSMNQFLFVPNGYVWDSRTQAWFKHADLVTGVAKYFTYDPTFQQMFWAGSTDGAQIGKMTPGDKAGTARVTSWQWTAAPLAPETSRPFDVREVELIVNTWDGTSVTYAVTVGSETHSAAITSTTPVILRFVFHSHVDSLKVRVTSTATGSNSAGVLREVRVGYRARGPATRAS